MNLRTTISLFFFSAACVAGCSKGSPEPDSIRAERVSAVGSASAQLQTTAGSAAPSDVIGAGSANSGSANEGELGPDPHKGSYTLAEATKNLPGKSSLVATLETTSGTLECKLFDDKAPVTVANFIGLATGKRAWKDPKTQRWVRRPAYDGTIFHRVIAGFMIQGGDAKGTGSGEPGYTIKDELWEGAKHDRAGLLCMANRGPNTNGAQFFITDAAAAHLDSGYTIFGECAPLATVHKIANTPVLGERPADPPKITKVTVARAK